MWNQGKRRAYRDVIARLTYKPVLLFIHDRILAYSEVAWKKKIFEFKEKIISYFWHFVVIWTKIKTLHVCKNKL